jgi:hypothetical protein
MMNADLFGASGGRGGDAGIGGAGGSGGSLTVYYTDIKSLKLIAVNAAPGFGGRSGIAGLGGAPCGCAQTVWEVPVRVCHEVQAPVPPAPAPGPQPAPHTGPGGNPGNGPGNAGNNPHPGTPDPHPAPGPVVAPPPPPPQTVCEIIPQRHFCQNGAAGSNGNSYADGASGSLGTATLIQSAAPLTDTAPNASLQIGSFPQSVVLTLDRWATAQGAAQFFADGSRIADSYRYYAGRVTEPVSFVWNTSRPQANFVSQAILTSVDESGKVAANLANESVFADLSVSYDVNGAATVSVNKVALATEMNQLIAASDALQGRDQGLSVQLSDPANVSDFVNTEVYAVVKSDGVFNHTRFDGNVPANLVLATANGLTIKVGQLAGIPSGDIKSGKKVKITLTITRGLGAKSLSQTIQIDGKIQ